MDLVDLGKSCCWLQV